MRLGGALGIAALWKRAEVHRIGLAVDWLPLRNQRDTDGFVRLENAVLLGLEYRRILILEAPVEGARTWTPSIGFRFGAAGRFDAKEGQPDVVDWGLLMLPHFAVDWAMGDGWTLGAEFALGPSLGRSTGIWSILKLALGMEF